MLRSAQVLVMGLLLAIGKVLSFLLPRVLGAWREAREDAPFSPRALKRRARKLAEAAEDL